MQTSKETAAGTVLPDHFIWIDGLRGIAALSVVIFHYHHFYLSDWTARADIPPTDTFAWSALFGVLYDYGSSAVQLFWVVSGFVFAHVYLSRQTSLRNFIGARIARLYPLHIATLIAVAGLQLASMAWVGHWQIYGQNDLRHFGLQVLMSSNWTTLSRGLSFNGPIWSVSLEIVAYGLFFICLPLIRYFRLFAVTALVMLMWWFGLDKSLDIPLVSRRAFICAGYFFLGTGAYLVLQRWGARSREMAALISIGVVLWAVGLWAGSSNLAHASACVVIVSAIACLDTLCRQPAITALRRLGDMSYSLYLVHVPVQMTALLVADIGFDGTRAFATSPLTLPIYLLVAIILADLAYRRFERPVSRYLRRVLILSPKRPR
jgi:peptidoglycan/LPS O-acetylase OafA/YrhL